MSGAPAGVLTGRQQQAVAAAGARPAGGLPPPIGPPFQAASLENGEMP